MGPWCGEFGWELMTWVPFCRHKARKRAVNIICQSGHEYLYRDFAKEICTYDYSGGNGGDRWNFSERPTVRPFVPEEFKAKFYGCDFVLPTSATCSEDAKRDYRAYGICENKNAFHVLIHARGTFKYGQVERNWSVAKWDAVVGWAISRYGRRVKIACIGSKKGAYRILGTCDLRGIPLGDLCDVMASSHVLMGPSSGPMHLGELTGTKRILWTDNKVYPGIKGTNRKRYELTWSPFRTQVNVIDAYGWDPPVETVILALAQVLNMSREVY
jgi:hypothetical protein